MKIIHLVLGKANPNRMNGVNKVAYQLASKQHEVGVDVEIWGLTSDLVHNYPSRPFATHLFKASFFNIGASLRSAIIGLSSDTVVQIHGVFIPVLDRIAYYLKRKGVPYIITPHGALTQGAMHKHHWRKRLYFKYITRLSCHNAFLVQTLGEQESLNLFELDTQLRQVLIPNGQDLKEIPIIPTKEVNEVPTFAFCGRLDSYHKGLDLMLEAFKQLVERGSQARLVLIGDGKDREELETFCNRYGLHDKIRFCGARYGDEKFLLLSECDYFLHTSRMEGFPVAVLEAAALGLPCLTTLPTSMNRYLKVYEAGFPIAKVEVESITAAMEAAVAVHGQAAMSKLQENAKRMIEEAFDWHDIARQLIRVYHKALA